MSCSFIKNGVIKFDSFLGIFEIIVSLIQENKAAFVK